MRGSATSTLTCFETFDEKSSNRSTWHRNSDFHSFVAPSTCPLRDARDALGATHTARTHVVAAVRGLVTVGDDALAGSTSHADETSAGIRRRTRGS